MAREEQTDKTKKELQDRAWELAEKIRMCVFTTWDGKKQVPRPMDATVRKEAGAIFFLTDVKSRKIQHLKKFPVTSLAFSDPSSMKFVTLSGEAIVSNDRIRIKDIWTATSKAWWESEDDPAIRLVTFVPKEAELWDSPNFLVSTVKMLTAAVTGAKPKLGDHARVRVAQTHVG
jgi:general stress protein 26